MTEPRERVSRFNRTAPRTQALLSAALLLPTLAIYAPIGLNNDFFVEFAFAASGGYFLAALAVVARSRPRRWWALAIAATTLVAEGLLVMVVSTDADLGLQTAFMVVAPVGYVAAWGVARRHSGWWKSGLPLAAVTVSVLRFALLVDAYDSTGTVLQAWWWWLLWPGITTLGCLACWAVDLRAARKTNRMATTTGPSTRVPFESPTAAGQHRIPAVSTPTP